MANQWLRTNVLTGCAIAFWLLGLAPVGQIGKGASLFLSLVASIQLIDESKRLIFVQAMAIATEAMHQEIAQTELVLATDQVKEELRNLHRTSNPEVTEELREGLESLYRENAAPETSDFPTSSDKKSLRLAVEALINAGKSETFIIEEVFKLGGRRFKEGRLLLDELLSDDD